MKIEIDLDNILGDESGAETLSESVRRQVTDNLTKTLAKGVRDQVSEAVNAEIDRAVRSAVDTQLPGIVDDLINAPYFPVTRYGDKAREQTTFRSELIKTIQEQCVYKPESYRDSENVFTKSVRAIVAEHMKKIENEFNGLVTREVAKNALDSATELLKKKLQLP